MSTANQSAVLAEYIFDGRTKSENQAVVIHGSHIADVVPPSRLSPSVDVHELPSGAWLAPGFIDIQVNGGGDVLFNNEPTSASIKVIAAAHRKFGTTSMLPTFITDTHKKMKAAIAAAETLVGQEPSVLGIHLEGPYLSPAKAGVHDARLMRSPNPEELEMLVAPRKGIRLITLAPEQVPSGFISRLVQSGIQVSLGHSMATYQETCAAMREGLSGFTHLFNAMRPLTSREPGPVAAAIESPNASYGMIVDGFHVDPVMLRLALRGSGHPILVTDAMPPVGGQQARFNLYDKEIEVVAGRCLRSDGKLAGAALDMITAIRNCVDLLGVSLEAALQFASSNPAEFLGLGRSLGKIAPGYRADLVAINPKTFEVLGTWVCGRSDKSNLAKASPSV